MYHETSKQPITTMEAKPEAIIQVRKEQATTTAPIAYIKDAAIKMRESVPAFTTELTNEEFEEIEAIAQKPCSCKKTESKRKKMYWLILLLIVLVIIYFVTKSKK